MLFDPDEGLTLEEKIVRVWHRLPSDIRERYEALSEHSGVPIWDLLIQAIELLLSRLDDPAELKAFIKGIADEEIPFGRDPLVTRIEG